MMASLDELRKAGFVPFTLGPLYTLAHIDFDIVARFAAESGQPADVTHFDFERFSFIFLQPPFNHRLFAMPDDYYWQFSDWLKAVQIVNRAEATFCRPICVGAPLLDPFVRFVGALAPKPEVIDVWTISAMTGKALPATHIEQLPYPIFKPGEAEELKQTNRVQFYDKLPRPATAPDCIILERKPPDPAVVIAGKAALGMLV
jgi:hypothetical protein